MKILFFYTSYRQVKEFDYQARFLERCPQLVDWADMLWFCNNIALPHSILEEKLAAMPFRKKTLIHKDVNQGGYARGQFEVLASQEDVTSEYDFVIHLHPDIFVARESDLVSLLKTFEETNIGFLVSRIFGNADPSFATDFFIYRPKFVPHRFFLDYLKYDTSIKTPLEQVLYRNIHDSETPYAEFTRFILGKYHRDIDQMGLWHEHQLNRIELFLRHPLLRYAYTAHRCILHNPRLTAGITRDYLLRSLRKQPQDSILKLLSVT